MFQGPLEKSNIHQQKQITCSLSQFRLNFIYGGLLVYGASEPNLNIIQNFLDRCHKRRFISYPVSIKDLLKNQDCKIFKKVTSINNHPLASYIPSKKVCSYNLMSAFVNRLIFKLNLSTGQLGFYDYIIYFIMFFLCFIHKQL